MPIMDRNYVKWVKTILYALQNHSIIKEFIL